MKIFPGIYGKFSCSDLSTSSWAWIVFPTSKYMSYVLFPHWFCILDRLVSPMKLVTTIKVRLITLNVFEVSYCFLHVIMQASRWFCLPCLQFSNGWVKWKNPQCLRQFDLNFDWMPWHISWFFTGWLEQYTSWYPCHTCLCDHINDQYCHPGVIFIVYPSHTLHYCSDTI